MAGKWMAGPASSSLSAADVDAPALSRLYADLLGRDEPHARAAAHHLIDFAREDQAVSALVAALSRSGLVAQEATSSLVAIGEFAVPVLIHCLGSPDSGTRWHAAVALTEIAVPESATAFVAALTDDDASVRWQAVKGLAAIGPAALPPLLEALATQTLTAWLATGAERVLRRLSPYYPEQHLDRLCRMLVHINDHVGVPLEAHRLLHPLPPARTAGRP